jgi:uncharacterized membrane protein YidH (DUF202 family)
MPLMPNSPPHSLLSRFRSDRKRLPLHPLEKAVLSVVALHLCFLPWAFGTMHVWSQLTSLVLSVAGLALALIPRNYSPDLSGGPAMRLTMWPRLMHFPIFWIGLALLGYIALQASNPSWIWTRNATSWWLVRVNDIDWLPTSIETPFDRFNVWRQFIIYASAWLTVCTVWTGFTRRRSLQLLITILVGNAIALAAVGYLQGLTNAETLLWLVQRPLEAMSFASFYNKNHAGAYLALTTIMTAALATWHFDQGEKSMKKSTPAGVLAFIAVFLAGTVLFTLSRGASIAMAICALLFFAWFFLRRRMLPGRSSNPAVSALVVMVFLGTLVGTARYLDFSMVYRGFDRILNRQKPEESVRFRVLAYDAGEKMLADYWQRGVGAGGFRYLFPEYIKKHPEAYSGGRLFWEHAHRDWFEIPIELGAAGCLLLLLGACYWLRFFYRQRALWHSLAIPVLIGCSQTLIHAWLDFPFQNPAILATWLTLIAVSARWIELESQTSGPS